MQFFSKIMEMMGLPVLASKHGAQVDQLILYVHILMIALFVGWSAYFVYALWRFRKSKNPKADYVGTTTHASSYIEVAVAVVEGVLLLGFAVPLWAASVDDFPDPKNSTVIRVVGRQFNWIARYPGTNGIFGKQDLKLLSGNNPMALVAKDPVHKSEDPDGSDDVIIEGTSEMAAPVDKPVVIHLSSLDVIHSFKIVPLRVTQDANPGMSIPFHFVPTLTNTYRIQCSQLCGNGHYSMAGTFKVLSQPDYDAWLKSKSAAGPGAGTGFE